MGHQTATTVPGGKCMSDSWTVPFKNLLHSRLSLHSQVEGTSDPHMYGEGVQRTHVYESHARG